jgi:hypothetical protein
MKYIILFIGLNVLFSCGRHTKCLIGTAWVPIDSFYQTKRMPQFLDKGSITLEFNEDSVQNCNVSLKLDSLDRVILAKRWSCRQLPVEYYRDSVVILFPEHNNIRYRLDLIEFVPEKYLELNSTQEKKSFHMKPILNFVK